MTSPCNHKQAFITPPHQGFQINPLSGGLSRSPCACRPDTGAPCVRLNLKKDHPSCENCALLGRGDCWNPEGYKPKYHPPKDKRIHECGFPGCKNTTKNEYCRRHGNTIGARIAAWKRDNPTKPIDIEWLHRPIEIRKANRGQGRKLKKQSTE